MSKCEKKWGSKWGGWKSHEDWRKKKNEWKQDDCKPRKSNC